MCEYFTNFDSLFYNKNITYYVCTFGGCGSYMLSKYLGQFGNVYHVHSRYPPTELTTMGIPKNHEWFSTHKIKNNKLKNYKVIYLYRNPIDAIYSRFHNSDHLYNVGIDRQITLLNCVEANKDLYKLDQFYDNYVNMKKIKKGKKRNYSIICVKYEDFFDNIEEFNKFFNLPNVTELYPIRRETLKEQIYFDELTNIYKPLINKMKKMKFIEIV
jgi:hypothetical protein